MTPYQKANLCLKGKMSIMSQKKQRHFLKLWLGKFSKIPQLKTSFSKQFCVNTNPPAKLGVSMAFGLGVRLRN